ncbi:DUF4062 domain-containing protein [Paenibacillus tepidiphilus]|uniref:DUF4062 domain-containing protein n=1 Tax=Paenibacillus tepidiphilus TaxID=2608683 RepID=UPI0012386246|nr:DUF4062 domain-containing protein [Paenibacillus tepidiphilus]
MKKQLQVFISSTYTDMIEERQAAILAVLNAGHIPVGMEDLFKLDDRLQKATIQRWIQESDVFMLILGGRYGGIDEESGKSHPHWEYDYAGELGKRRIAMVISDRKLADKTQDNPTYLERINYPVYLDFKGLVLQNGSELYEDVKDIRLITMEALRKLESDPSLVGWIRADQVESVEETLRENAALLKEIARLKAENAKLKQQQEHKVLINGMDYEDIKNILETTVITLPKEASSTKTAKDVSLLKALLALSNIFATGVTNGSGESDNRLAVYYHVTPKLLTFGILEKVKVAGARFERIQMSKEGHKFLAKYLMENAPITPVVRAKPDGAKTSVIRKGILRTKDEISGE